MQRAPVLPRTSVTVRDARPPDLPRVLELWDELRRNVPRRPVRSLVNARALRDEAEQRFVRAMSATGERLVVAVAGDEPVGMALLSLGSASTLSDTPAVHMTHVCVDPRRRRRGAGRALTAAATAWAEEVGAEGVAIALFPQSRESNRFFARLGFAPVSVTRVAPVARLRRQLGPEVPAPSLDESSGERRRRLRVEVTSGRSAPSARRRLAR